MIINEDVKMNDLEHLVSNYISVDQYTSKVDEDNITVAFFVNERDAMEELKDVIEKMYFIELRDIEMSESLTSDNKYLLFVELERNVSFPKILMDMIDTVNFVTNNKKWNIFGCSIFYVVFCRILWINISFGKWYNELTTQIE